MVNDQTTVAASDGPNASPRSSDYWRTMDGSYYQELIAERTQAGQLTYRQQEAVLLSIVDREKRATGQELSALEFGCGFGRHARTLSSLPGLAYHGYDFSERMVAPLRADPPAALVPLENHLFVGAKVVEAVEPRRFDLAFTVSVLIHNPPQVARQIVLELLSLLTPTGLLCLIENQLVPFSVYENNWHDGCWLHRIVDYVPAGYELRVTRGAVNTHDVYEIRRSPTAETGHLLLLTTADDLRSQNEVSEAELDRLGLPKLHAWAQSTEQSIRDQGLRDERQLSEQRELLVMFNELLAKRRNLWTIADQLAVLRSQPKPSSQVTHTPLQPPQQPAELAGLLVDDPYDTRWAHETAAYHRVAHVFHQEWHGVRAAAGYSPGHKLAITSKRRLTPIELDEALRACQRWQTEQVVFHGFSEMAEELVRVLHARLRGVELRAVYYGTTAQFHYNFEREMLERLCNLRRNRLLSGLAGVKPGLHLLDDTIEPLLLLSLPPRQERVPKQRNDLLGAALIPVPVDWRKNFYTNLLAAAGVQRFDTVYVTSDVPGTQSFKVRARVTPFVSPTRSQLFRLMSTSDVVCNATLSECQPLTALEALSLRVPCFTGPLGLGSLDEHPLQRLLQVRQVDSLEALRTAIEKVLDLRTADPERLWGMMADYQETLESQAFERWGRFLRL